MERLLKIAIFGILLLAYLPLSAQENAEKASRVAKKYMQQAEEALKENDLATAEAFYRQAIAEDPSNAAARYNLGNIYYNNEITGEAVERHSQSAKVAEEKPLKHDSFHNQGNSFMKQKKYKEAVEAYKNSLRNNPNDEETRYNYALAKKLLEEEKKGGGEDDKNQDKQDQQDQKQDQQKDKEQQEGDQGDKEQNDDGKPEEKDKGGEKDKKEGDDEKDDKGKPQDKNQQKDQGDKSKEEQPKQPQPRPGQLSPQQVKNLLEAMGNQEKKVQEKINAEKVKGSPTKTEKDW